jgi:hypothetical protein
MWVTLDDAIKMYARACRAWYGASAAKRVRAKARVLEKQGDIEGWRVWNEVAIELDSAPAKDKTLMN